MRTRRDRRRGGVILLTARLRLRPFAASDIPAYAAIRAKPEVVAMLPGGPEAAARAAADAERLVPTWAAAAPGGAPWAAEARDGGGRLLGHLGLRPLPELGGETELLYMLDSDAWGRGLATEGAAAALRAAFGLLGLRRVIALARPENAASVAVVRKLGMRFEGEVEAFGLRVVRYAAHAPPPEGEGACTTG